MTHYHLDGSQSQKYVYHDDPHSFETSMDYIVVASNNNSLSLGEIGTDLDKSPAPIESHEANAAEHIYSNSHFKFEVLETTVWACTALCVLLFAWSMLRFYCRGAVRKMISVLNHVLPHEISLVNCSR